jgi:hypothetical protein
MGEKCGDSRPAGASVKRISSCGLCRAGSQPLENRVFHRSHSSTAPAAGCDKWELGNRPASRFRRRKGRQGQKRESPLDMRPLAPPEPKTTHGFCRGGRKILHPVRSSLSTRHVNAATKRRRKGGWPALRPQFGRPFDPEARLRRPPGGPHADSPSPGRSPVVSFRQGCAGAGRSDQEARSDAAGAAAEAGGVQSNGLARARRFVSVAS